MGDNNKIIDSHLWDQRKRTAKILVIILLFIALSVSWTLYNHFGFSSITDREMLVGTVESLHQSQSLLGADIDHFFIRLDSNDLIKVSVGRERGTPFRKDANVEIEKVVRESGKVEYIFFGYQK